MGVVDELVRQERVKQRLDRRIWCRGIDEVLALYADHLLVVQRFARAQLAQAFEPNGGKASRLDARHVGA